MPPADRNEAHKPLLRTLLYGSGKTRKTWWALRCAEAGFNVILIDGDDGSHIVKQIPPEHRGRILIVDAVNSNNSPVFSIFMATLLKKNNKFNWDEQAKKEVPGRWDAEHSHIVFDARKLGPSDVLIIDSWTALADSTNFKFAEEQKLDLSDADKTEWAGYGFSGRFLDWVLSRLHTLECHVIVIAHTTTYEKWDRRSPNPKEHKLLETQIVPISSSGPHGKKLAKHFSDVLFFERVSAEKSTIDTGGTYDRDGGSRILAPKKWDWNELSPAKLFEILSAKPSGKPCEGAVWYDVGENPAVATTGQTAEVASAPPAQQREVPVLNAPKPGLSSLGLKLGGGKR